MDAELKAKWVAALRSGEYKQCENVLTTGEAYCCLGVLRELIAPGSTDTSEDSEHLSDAHSDQAGLTNEHQLILAGKNDSGVGFPQIADWIEANL